MPKACAYCGEPRQCDVLEAWAEPGQGVSFQLATCCEGVYEEALAEFSSVADQSTGRPGKRARRAFALWWRDQTGATAGRLREDFPGLSVTSPLALVRCGPGASDPRALSCSEVRAFVKAHHRHASAPPAGWRWGYAIYSGRDLIGVAMVGRPASRRIDGTTVLDVSRICIAAQVSPLVRGNACSLIYARAARDGRRAGFGKLITYTLEAEQASGCRAVGMVPEYYGRGGSWDSPSRRRSSANATGRRVRWALALT